MTPRLLLLSLTLAAACDGMPAARCDVTGDVTGIDLDADGRPDVRKFTRGGRELCRETDLNFDGKPDQIHVRDAGRGASWLCQDFDADGRCDRLELHAPGRPVEELIDLDHDGDIDVRRPVAPPPRPVLGDGAP
jgi:hypothetical protein